MNKKDPALITTSQIASNSTMRYRIVGELCYGNLFGSRRLVSTPSDFLGLAAYLY